MTTTTLDTPVGDAYRAVAGKAADASRQVTHIADEARVLKDLAAEALDDGRHAAKRAFKAARRRAQRVADLRDEALYRVKREPLKAVGLALGAGLVIGLVVGLAGRRRPRYAADPED